MKNEITIGDFPKGLNLDYHNYLLNGVILKFSKEEYKKILSFFSGKVVNIGTSRTNPPEGTLGRWIELNMSKTVTTSFIGAILLKEEYAIKTKNRAEIKFL